MEPGSKNWLFELIEHQKQSLEKTGSSSINHLFRSEDDVDTFTYRILHTTGLIFGYPIRLFVKNHPQMEEWGDRDSIKLIFAESMLNISLHKHFIDKENTENIDALFEQSVADLLTFYEHVEGKLSGNKLESLFGKEVPDRLKVERYFDKRVDSKSILHKSFWSGVLYNAFLFLDTIFFSEYMKSGMLPSESDFYNLKKVIVEVVLCGIRANGQLHKQEKVLFTYFLKGTNFSSADTNFYTGLLERGMAPDAIEIDSSLPLLQKKVIVEMCVIAILADNTFSEEELQFLNTLAERIELSQQDLDESILFTESFLLKNADKIVYLQNKHSVGLLGKSLNKRVSAAISKNKANISREIAESKELMELLWKSQNQALTDEEREKVKSQLTDIVKTIPSLAIFLVPGGSILLPLLLKVLPEEIVMPSSFRNSTEA